ncbi:MAG TPA: SpoIID/LytB domain-containing protein, partial [Bdellovibrionales bacterium]|nr:SpoIID/LytB domain-containing protein [Bdellovibrionales bacterium]
MFFIAKRILAASAAALLVSSCAKNEEPVQVMWQSPVPPADVPSKTPLAEGYDYSKIFVRVFPILKTPKGEPYPVSQIRDIVDLQNEQGVTLWAEGMQIAPAAKDVQLNFKDGKFYLKNVLQGDQPAVELAAREVTVKGGPPATRVTYNKGLGAAESSRLYRGEFIVTPTDFVYDENGQSKKGAFWSLINVVGIEDYLISVVPSEVPVSWHANALDAQAVAARTYAVKELIEARKKKQNWDVDPTTQYQSYRGLTIEKEPTTAAVGRTRGVVMTYKGDIFLSFFSANSGGITCDASDCLERPDAGYAVSKTDAIEMGTQNVTGGTWKACTSLPLI